MLGRLTAWRGALVTAAAGTAAALTLSIASGAPSGGPNGPSASSCPDLAARPKIVDTPPDPRLAVNLGILRRPVGADDAPDAEAVRRLRAGDGVHLADARLLRADAAGRAWIVPVDDVRPHPLPERCVARAPAAERAALRRRHALFSARSAQPGVVILTDGRSAAGPSSASLASILAGSAVEASACAGPSHDMVGVSALLPDGEREPYLRFRDGHTVLGDLRDNAVTFLLAKPERREQLPIALGWTDQAGNPRATALPGGSLSIEHCAAPSINRDVVARVRAPSTAGRAGDRNAEMQGRKIALQAVREAAGASACQAPDPSSQPFLQDGRPLRAITDLLPALATPSTPGETRRARALLPAGMPQRRILRSTLRVIDLSDEARVIVYVQAGVPGASRDPAGCGRERHDRALTLARDRPPAVRDWALRRLAQLRDTIPGLQTLSVLVQRTEAHGRGATSGSGTPATLGHPLHPGLLSGSSGPRSVYVGIVGRRTVRVLIQPQHNRAHARIARAAKVIDGLYAVVLPRHTGPVTLREATRNGTIVRTIRLRERTGR